MSAKLFLMIESKRARWKSSVHTRTLHPGELPSLPPVPISASKVTVYGVSIVVHPWSGDWGILGPGILGNPTISRVQQTIDAPLIGSCQD